MEAALAALASASELHAEQEAASQTEKVALIGQNYAAATDAEARIRSLQAQVDTVVCALASAQHVDAEVARKLEWVKHTESLEERLREAEENYRQARAKTKRDMDQELDDMIQTCSDHIEQCSQAKAIWM